MNKLALYCRPGFEKECAAEITARAAELGIYGFPRVKQQSGYVLYECYQYDDADNIAQKLPLSSLIFARQMIVVGELLKDLPSEDRITPIIGMLTNSIEKAGDLRVEVPDTNESKELMKFCRKFTVPLRQALRQNKLLLPYPTASNPIIHVFFIARGCCYVGYSYGNNTSPYYMGIPRLKFPADAPSRSTLKLEEAFHEFIPADEWQERLASGMYAVDLGACPGGWTYQLVQRGMMVYAIDNGAIAASLMDTGQVTHLLEDGFRYTPKNKNITWLVCDMVEKPSRVAKLVADWIGKGWCREAIFNLKLPMKKRYEEVIQNIALINQLLSKAEVNAQVRAKQLYHDREEVTVHIRRVWGAQPGHWSERQRQIKRF